MTKFGKKLKKLQVSEWRTKYCHYSRLKKLLKPIILLSSHEQKYTDKKTILSRLQPNFSESKDIETDLIIDEKFADSDHFDFTKLIDRSALRSVCFAFEYNFFNELSSQFNKIREFYDEKIESFRLQLNTLIELLTPFEDPMLIMTREDKKKLRGLKHSAREVYRGLKLLENYRKLNAEAFKKILKKHDKFSSWNESGKAFEATTFKTSIYRNNLIEILFKKCEEIYICVFSGGNRKRGKAELTVTKKKPSHKLSFMNGSLYGVSLFCTIVLIFSVNIIWKNAEQKKIFKGVFPLFRVFIMFALYLTLWGIDKIILENKQINYHFIMEMAPKNRLSVDQVLLVASSLLTLSLLGINFQLAVQIQPFVYFQNDFILGFMAVAFFWTVLITFFLPLKTLYHGGRLFIFRLIIRIFKIAFIKTRFMDFFLMDQTCSFQLILIDLGYCFCYTATGCFLNDPGGASCKTFSKYWNWCFAVLPFFIRFLQCSRRYLESKDSSILNLVNAFKYLFASSFAFSAQLFANYKRNNTFALYLTFALISTTYSFVWDIMVDFGLLQLKYGFWLREKLIFSKIWYWVAIVSNLLLRATWVLYISPYLFGVEFFKSIPLSTLLATLELLRRFQWNIYRLENEHLTNFGNFRATNVIPLGNVPEKENSEESLATINK